MMNKKNFIYTFVGILIGIGITLGVAYYLVEDKVVDNYSDEVQILSTVLEKSADPVFQKNYVLAGLTLSSDFQEYLEYGVQNGWWTEEFLAQVLIDDVIPVYISQYSGTIKIIASTDKVQEIMDKLDDLKVVISNLPLDKIASIVNRLLGMSLPNMENLKAKLASLGEIRTEVIQMINKLKGNLSKLQIKLEEIEGKLPEIAGKVETVKDMLDDIADAIDEIEQMLPTFYENMQDILAKLEEIQIILQDIYNTVNEHLPEILEMIDKIENIIDKIGGLLVNSDLSDFQFVEGENVFLGQTINLTKIQAKILNAIDLTIVIDTYDNGGTAVNPADDTLVIGQVYVAFESTGKDGIDIVLGNITITGAPALLINNNVDEINSLI